MIHLERSAAEAKTLKFDDVRNFDQNGTATQLRSELVHFISYENPGVAIDI